MDFRLKACIHQTCHRSFLFLTGLANARNFVLCYACRSASKVIALSIGASTNRGIINIYMALLATFVGVGKHTDPSIRDLIGATRDALAMHALFVDTISDIHADLLVDSNATLEAIRHSLQNTLGSATGQDTVIFYFSGHGSHDHRMAATDTRLVDLADTALPMQELAEHFKQSKAKAIFCVLDCCFSGGAPGKVLEESRSHAIRDLPFQHWRGTGEFCSQRVQRTRGRTNTLVRATVCSPRPSSIFSLLPIRMSMY
jgi:hypothetical protein